MTGRILFKEIMREKEKYTSGQKSSRTCCHITLMDTIHYLFIKNVSNLYKIIIRPSLATYQSNKATENQGYIINIKKKRRAR